MTDDAENVQVLPKARIRRYVEFLYAGSFTADCRAEEVGHADPALIDVPDGAYAFRFFDVQEIEDEGTVLRSDRLNKSMTFYPDGVLTTVEQAREMPNSRILVSNMEGNGWPAVVFSRYGNFPQPFNPAKDAIIPLCTRATPTGATP